MRSAWRQVDIGWGRRAADFATITEPGNCREYVSVHNRLGFGGGDRVLDVACGSGLAMELARARGASCAGIDASARLVAVARDRNPDADIVIGDMGSLPWEDESFDIVTSFRGIWATTPDALSEARHELPGIDQAGDGFLDEGGVLGHAGSLLAGRARARTSGRSWTTRGPPGPGAATPDSPSPCALRPACEPPFLPQALRMNPSRSETAPEALEDPQAVAEERFRSLRQLVGNTPVAVIRARYAGVRATVCAKLEVFNLTGSIKDRMALWILESAWRQGALSPGDTISEATSGNTGISFAAIGRALGHDVRIAMPDWMSRERKLVIESLGAEIVPVSREEGGFRGAIEAADAFARDNQGVFRPQQFDNAANVEAHERATGPELLAQLRADGLEPRAFVAGVGTGGTVMGVGHHLRGELGDVRVHPLEPANSPTLRTGVKTGSHRIQGISDEFVPAIVDLDWLDGIVDVDDGDAIRTAQRLARELGLAVGISSGANFAGALRVAAELGDGAVVATVFPDSNKKYLSTDLCKEEPARPGHVADEAVLDGCRVLPRLAPA